MSEENNNLEITEEDKKAIFAGRKKKEREGRLQKMFDGENGDVYKELHETGGLKEMLVESPELLDSDATLAVAANIVRKQVITKSNATEAEKKPESETVAQTQKPLTPVGGQQLPDGEATFNPATVSVKDLIEKGKMTEAQAAAFVAAYRK